MFESQPENKIYILKQCDPSINKEYILNTFFYKKSEINNEEKIITLVYENKIMILKINKNKANLRIIINDIYFKEGIYNIDLNKIYDKYGEENINIERFPTEEDIDQS